MKVCRVEIKDGVITVPPEILEVLPQGSSLYARTDTEKGRVVIYAEDPTVLKNQWYFDEMAKEMEGVDWREYYNDGPIPPELLGKNNAYDRGEDDE